MKELTQDLNNFVNKWSKVEYIKAFLNKYIRVLSEEHDKVIGAYLLRNMQSKFEYEGVNDLFKFIKEIEREYIKN